MMRSFFIHVFIVILVAENCLALRCYICDSSVNEKCVDLSDKNLVPHDCNEKSLSNTSGILMTLLKLTYKNTAHLEEHFVCQKAIGELGNGTKIVVRRCNVKIDSPNSACNHTIQNRLPNTEFNSNSFECSECEEDDCNSADLQHIWLPFTILMTSFSALKQLI